MTMGKDILEKSTLKVLPIEVIKLYYEMGLVRFNDFRDKEAQATDRGYKLISLYLGIITALSSYIYIKWSELKDELFPLMALLIGTSLASAFILMVILPRNYMPKGRKPSEYIPNEMAKALKDINDDTIKYKCILSKELNELEKVINEQSKYNKKRTRLFEFSFIIEILGVLIALILFLTI